MRYEFVDIGTSFFCTSVDEYGLEVNGLLVEPIKEYLNAIPSSSTVKKANYAIGDSDRSDIIFVSAPIENVKYISKLELDKLRLHQIDMHHIGIRGCNRLGEKHPQSSLVEKTACEVITFHSLCKMHDITEIGQLKIDTEGHEATILAQVLSEITSDKIKITERIIFEYNGLADKVILDLLIEDFKKNWLQCRILY